MYIIFVVRDRVIKTRMIHDIKKKKKKYEIA